MDPMRWRRLAYVRINSGFCYSSNPAQESSAEANETLVVLAMCVCTFSKQKSQYYRMKSIQISKSWTADRTRVRLRHHLILRRSHSMRMTSADTKDTVFSATSFRPLLCSTWNLLPAKGDGWRRIYAVTAQPWGERVHCPRSRVQIRPGQWGTSEFWEWKNEIIGSGGCM